MLDPTRILESLPVIRDLATNAKKLVVIGHLGRPEGRSDALSFRNNILNHMNMEFADDTNECVFLEHLNEETTKIIGESNERGKIYLIENIRFFKEEESKDVEARMAFAKMLSYMGDVFVNDAFADYRESASTYDLPQLLPSYLGSLFLKEVEMLSKFNNPERPLVSILGGSKLSEKLDVMNSLLQISDKVLVGGAMAYTLLKAKGVEIGTSLFEEDKVEMAKELMAKYGDKLMLPIDHMIVDKFDKSSESTATITENEQIHAGKIAIDIGTKTIAMYKNIISGASSILWNGPMGVYEWSFSQTGTKEIGFAIDSNTNAFKLAGGGDSIAAINKFGIKNIDHICTGGGAMLAFLANTKFPTLDVIASEHL
jgi:3-phosphoglycerate kinase